MTAQKGKDLLLKIDTDGARQRSRPSPGCARGRSRSTPRASTSPTPTPPAAGASCSPAPGVKRASVSGSGIFKDAATDATVRQVFFDGTIRDWQVIVPDFGTLAGRRSR